MTASLTALVAELRASNDRIESSRTIRTVRPAAVTRPDFRAGRYSFVAGRATKPCTR